MIPLDVESSLEMKSIQLCSSKNSTKMFGNFETAKNLWFARVEPNTTRSNWSCGVARTKLLRVRKGKSCYMQKISNESSNRIPARKSAKFRRNWILKLGEREMKAQGISLWLDRRFFSSFLIAPISSRPFWPTLSKMNVVKSSYWHAEYHNYERYRRHSSQTRANYMYITCLLSLPLVFFLVSLVFFTLSVERLPPSSG